MPLTGAQITRLASELDARWDIPTLSLFARNLGINLANIAPGASMLESAVKFVTIMNSARPPRDRELLEALRGHGNAALRNLANELALPPYFSPTGDEHDAIMLGKAVFVDRAELRRKLREFTSPNPNTTRVLIIRGEEPCGKSYSWPFLRHLAKISVGAEPLRLKLENADYTTRSFVQQIFWLLDMDQTNLPPMLDNPQPARIDPLINAFKGQLSKLSRPYWLVIDDLNHASVTQPIRETAYAIAYAVEESKPENLWVALIGYNSTITDSELQLAAQDDARFPSADLVAEYLEAMANAGPRPLARRTARRYAELLLEKFPVLSKEAMMSLTPLIADLGEKLKRGERPSASRRPGS